MSTGFKALGGTLAAGQERTGRAMAGQVKRVNAGSGHDLAETNRQLVHENLQLTREVERLTALLAELQGAADSEAINARILQQAEAHSAQIATIGGRAIGSQKQYADRWNVKQWQVCRWVKAGELKTSKVNGQLKPYVFMDQEPPPPKARGRRHTKEKAKEGQAL